MTFDIFNDIVDYKPEPEPERYNFDETDLCGKCKWSSKYTGGCTIGVIQSAVNPMKSCKRFVASKESLPSGEGGE